MIRKIKNLFKKEIKENIFEVNFTNLSNENLKKTAYEEYSKNQTICLKCFANKFGYIGILAILEYNSINNINTSFEVLAVLENEILRIKKQLIFNNIVDKLH